MLVGVLANDILPAKAGEVVRCFLLSYEAKVPLSLAVTSDVILRIMDGLWIVIVYLMITFQISTHVDVTRGMWFFGTGAVAIALVLLFVLFRRQHAHQFVRTTSWAARFVHLLDEIHRLGHWRELRGAMAIGGFYWLFQMLAIWALTKADRFDLGHQRGGIPAGGESRPDADPERPRQYGRLPGAVVYAFGFLLVERVNAQAFAEIMFGFLTLPAAVGGAVAVVFADIDLLALHRHANRAHGKPGLGK